MTASPVLPGNDLLAMAGRIRFGISLKLVTVGVEFSNEMLSANERS
jgi:hypothetical protein